MNSGVLHLNSGGFLTNSGKLWYKDPPKSGVNGTDATCRALLPRASPAHLMGDTGKFLRRID